MKENIAKTATCWQALQHGIKPGSLSQCFSFPLSFVVEELGSSAVQKQQEILEFTHEGVVFAKPVARI